MLDPRTGRPAVRALLPEADQIVCDLGAGPICKMFRRSVSRYSGRVHAVVIPAGRIVRAEGMRIEHHQAHAQAGILPVLEYEAATACTGRTLFYLGREYLYAGEWDRALTVTRRYLDGATFQPEIEKARVHEARALWNLDRGDEAREAAWAAVRLNPDDREALGLMSEFHWEPWKSKWSAIASRAGNDGVLY